MRVDGFVSVLWSAVWGRGLDSNPWQVNDSVSGHWIAVTPPLKGSPRMYVALDCLDWAEVDFGMYWKQVGRGSTCLHLQPFLQWMDAYFQLMHRSLGSSAAGRNGNIKPFHLTFGVKGLPRPVFMWVLAKMGILTEFCAYFDCSLKHDIVHIDVSI